APRNICVPPKAYSAESFIGYSGHRGDCETDLIKLIFFSSVHIKIIIQRPRLVNDKKGFQIDDVNVIIES
ncbi:MAG: hypothetical protein WC993_12000, partial [Methanoculleus sp.]